MQQRLRDEGIENVRYKGVVEKKYTPFIVSHADINFMHAAPTSLYRYGASPNKLFDYLAAGCPIMQDFTFNGDIVSKYVCGVSCDWDIDRVEQAFDELYHASAKQRAAMREGALKAAADYDFANLTRKLISIIERI